MSKPSIASSDRNMATGAISDNGLKYYNIAEPPFKVAGLPFFYIDGVFRRLPANPVPAAPNEGVEHLSWHTAGAQLRFRSNSSRVTVKVESRFDELMDHMPQTGICGCDLYSALPGEPLRFWGVSRYGVGELKYETELFNSMNTAPVMREFAIHFPLYNGVKSFEVGLDENAEIEPPSAWSKTGAIIWYGTSIQQGGCANRPGMASTNILSRKLNMEIVNLGFSGSGKGEKEIAELMCQIPDPAMFILDYEANAMTLENLSATLPVLIDILREKYPDLPIVVISRIKFSHDQLADLEHDTSRNSRLGGAEIQRKEVERRRQDGDANIYFIDGGTLLGEDYEECTVDGIHPTDLGFYRIAENLEAPLKKILGL